MTRFLGGDVIFTEGLRVSLVYSFRWFWCSFSIDGMGKIAMAVVSRSHLRQRGKIRVEGNGSHCGCGISYLLLRFFGAYYVIQSVQCIVFEEGGQDMG